VETSSRSRAIAFSLDVDVKSVADASGRYVVQAAEPEAFPRRA
jgi:hypothetical protein